MNLSKLGRENWVEPGNTYYDNQSLINKYKLDIKDIDKQINSPNNNTNTNNNNNTLNSNNNTYKEILSKSKSKREFINETNKSSDSLPIIKKTNEQSNKNNKPTNQQTQSNKTLNNNFSAVYERPPNRSDIIKLENELTSRVNEVFNPDKTLFDSLNNNNLYQPYKDDMIFIRNRIINEFNQINNEINSNDNNSSDINEYKTVESIEDEPWINNIINCEYLNIYCDNITSKLINMISVNSIELGNILRKIKLTYKQSFDQLFESYNHIRSYMLLNDKKIIKLIDNNKYLTDILNNNEKILNEKNQIEKNELEKNFLDEKKYLLDIIKQSDNKINQMNDTIHSLNNIFQSIYNTQANNQYNTISNNLTYDNLVLKLKKLEQENHLLYNNNIQIDVLTNKLKNYESIISDNELKIKGLDSEIINLKYNLIKKDDGINALINENLLKNLEIEKLKIQIEKNQKELENIELKELATSVLCIKCKKGLDDLTNIRSTLLDGYLDPNNSNNNDIIEYGYGNYNYNTLTNYKILLKNLKCEKYRILLPNLKGKHPNRSMDWVRKTARSILISKLNEDINIQSIHGNISRFPQYVYSWFDRSISNLIIYNPVDVNNQETLLNKNDNNIAKSMILSDEDRWGLYYGIRTLSRENDPEGIILWSLLDEYYGDDGLAFILHCLSVVLSLSGLELFNQFGYDVMYNNSNINVFNQIDITTSKVNRYIWIDVLIAKEATRLILVKALQSHLVEVIDAIDAFTVIPDDNVDVSVSRPMTSNTELSTRPSTSTTSFNELNNSSDNDSKPTHINIYLWLRLMLQQLHAEQIQRSAAVKLMFETASIGTLLPSDISTSDDNTSLNHLNSDGHIEYPQFQSICRSIFTNIPIVDIATLYTQCYSNKNYNKNTKRKVNADVFLKVACSNGLFARYLKLSNLPIYSRYKELLVINKQLDDNNNVMIELSNDINNKYITNLSNEIDLRSKLGSIIHIHLASIRSDIKAIISTLPDKYKNLLIESLDQLNSSIDYNYIKYKRKLKTKKNERLDDLVDDTIDGKLDCKIDSKIDSNLTKYGYLDGIQPFVYYNRLLTLLAFIKSLTENPLLPSNLFYNYSKASYSSIYPLNIGLQQVNNYLNTLEETIVINKYGNQSHKSKWLKYNRIKRQIYLRVIQKFIYKFIRYNVHIPKLMRVYMRPGYLYGITNYKYNRNVNAKYDNNIQLSNQPIYKRNNLLDTYIVQSLISEIYLYKIQYDKKFNQIQLPQLTIHQAIVDYMNLSFGNIDIAERLIHDLMFSISIYKIDNYRIKLFRLFIGNCNKLYNDIDDNVSMYLSTPQAFSVYLSILTTIRKQILFNISQSNNPMSRSKGGPKKKENMMRIASHASTASSTSGTDLHLDSLDNEIDLSSDSTNVSPYHNIQSISYNVASRVLYHSSINPINKVDSKDIWYESIDTITQAIKKWSKQQKGLDIYTNSNIYIQVLDKLTIHNEIDIDVDEVIYYIMLQWVKVMIWFVKKSTQRLQSMIRKNQLDSNTASEIDINLDNKTDTKVDIYSCPIYKQKVNHNYLIDLFESLYNPTQTTNQLNDAISNINEEESVTIAQSDSNYYLSKYLQIYTSKFKSHEQIDQYIRDCILFDLNIGFDRNIIDTCIVSTTKHTTNYPSIRHNTNKLVVGSKSTSSIDKDIYSVSPVLLITVIQNVLSNYIDSFIQTLDQMEIISTTQGNKDEDMSQRTYLYSIRRLINDLSTQISTDLDSSNAIPLINATSEDSLDSYGYKNKEIWEKFRHITRSIDDLTAKYNMSFPSDKYYHESTIESNE